MISTIIILVLNLALIVMLKSWYDRNRIAKGKHIYHGWEIALAVAWGLLVTWRTDAGWRSIPFETAFFWIGFDLSINLGRGKRWSYIGSSWNDLIFKKLFGQDAEEVMALTKIFFLIASLVLFTLFQSVLR